MFPTGGVGQWITYRMRSVFSAIEMDHAVDASKGCAATLVTVGIEFLLGEDITTVLPS